MNESKMYKYSYGAAGQWRGVANSSLPRQESRAKFIARQPLLTSPAKPPNPKSQSPKSFRAAHTSARAALACVNLLAICVSHFFFSSLNSFFGSIELLRRELRKEGEGEREKKLIVGQLEIANGALRFVFCVKVDRHRTETFNNYQTSKDLRTRSDELNEPSHLAFKIRREDESFSFSLLDSVSQREQFRV